MEDYNIRDFIRFNVLTTSEAAELAQISKSMINKLVDDEIIIPVKKSAQGVLFLKSDIEDYIKSKKRHVQPCSIRKEILYEKEANTRDCVKFFKEHRSQLSQIDAIFVYFNNLDAILDDFYEISYTNGFGGIKYLDNPFLVIRDVDGKEIWLGGCNCGYGGTGPHGTADILKFLVQEGTLPESKFTKDYIDKLIWNRKISIKRNEKGIWEVNSSQSSFDDIDSGASLYSFNDTLVLIQEPNYYKNESALKVINAYQAFIPKPINIQIFPTNEMAEEEGFVLIRNFRNIRKRIYNIIITDKSGRQIWLHSYFNDKKNIINNPSIKSILESCGFLIDTNELSKDKADPNIIKRILNWCETTFNSESVKPIIIENKNIL